MREERNERREERKMYAIGQLHRCCKPVYFFVILIGSQLRTLERKLRSVVPAFRSRIPEMETIF